MDPDATWDVLNSRAPFDERAQAAEDLAGWFNNGGHTPLTLIRSGWDPVQFYGFVCGFIEAVKAVRAMPEVEQLRTDLLHVDKNTQHIVDSSARLLEALRD